MVERILMAKYDVESREVLSPMYACISMVEASDAKFNLKSEKEKEDKNNKEEKKEAYWPNPNFLQLNWLAL